MFRKHVFVSGRVQGVYFRVFVLRSAQEAGVKGWVKNTRDRRVEAVFEGPREALEKVIRLCWQGPPASRVENVEVIDEKYSGEYADFRIVSGI